MGETHGNSDEAVGHNKAITIIVNGRTKEVAGKEITYAEVVRLAFGDGPAGPNTLYTVTYRRGDDHRPEGTMVAGDSVKLKTGMIFNVSATDKS